MILMGYRQSQEDHTLFIKHSTLKGVTILIIYVDDIIKQVMILLKETC